MSETSPMSVLDTMFGLHTHQIGDATLRVRRVLTVEQQRLIAGVVTTSAQTNHKLRDLTRMDTTTPEGVEILEKEVLAVEEGLRIHLIDAINMMVLGGIPELETISITTLSWLFNELRDVVENKTEAAVAATGFPTKGA